MSKREQEQALTLLPSCGFLEMKSLDSAILLSPEDWLCSSVGVKCWTGSLHSERGRVTTAQLEGHLENKTRSCTLFPPAPGSWDVLVESGT